MIVLNGGVHIAFQVVRVAQRSARARLQSGVQRHWGADAMLESSRCCAWVAAHVPGCRQQRGPQAGHFQAPPPTAAPVPALASRKRRSSCFPTALSTRHAPAPGAVPAPAGSSRPLRPTGAACAARGPGTPASPPSLRVGGRRRVPAQGAGQASQPAALQPSKQVCVHTGQPCAHSPPLPSPRRCGTHWAWVAPRARAPARAAASAPPPRTGGCGRPAPPAREPPAGLRGTAWRPAGRRSGACSGVLVSPGMELQAPARQPAEEPKPGAGRANPCARKVPLCRPTRHTHQ